MLRIRTGRLWELDVWFHIEVQGYAAAQARIPVQHGASPDARSVDGVPALLWNTEPKNGA